MNVTFSTKSPKFYQYPLPKLQNHNQNSNPLMGFCPLKINYAVSFFKNLRARLQLNKLLSNVCIDVNVDIIGKVLNFGNLSGEAMVTFFNWALKQPMVPKDVVGYHVIVKALGRRKFFIFMMQDLDEMKLNGVKADLLMLSIVIDSFVNAGHVSKAIQLFGNLDGLGLDRDTDALNVLLLCLCRSSHVGAAASVFNSMKGR
jgi:pentatricopeptide repeat protein